MATPPFLPDETKPGASDLISLFPAVEQTFRDVMETWMLVGHNTTGEHKAVTVNSGGATNAILSEDNLNRASTDDKTFNIRNSSSGSMTLQVDGVVVPTISSTSTFTNKTLTSAKANNLFDLGGVDSVDFSTADEIRLKIAGTTKLRLTATGMRVSASGTEVDIIRDEDDMSSNDAMALVTQQSVKAFVVAERMAVEGVVSTSSGSTKTFGSLKAGANRITIVFDSVSLSGTDDILVQIGDAGGIETSVYVSKASDTAAEGPSHKVTSTSGFIIYNGSGAGASNKVSGRMTLLRVTSNVWVSDHVLHGTAEDVNSGGVLIGAGRKSLSAELTQVRLTRTGSNTFDNGQINVFVE